MFSEIRAVFSRRYLLQSTAMEVFMANRSKWKVAIIAFEKKKKNSWYNEVTRLAVHSISPVQLSRPGHSKESDLQSSSGWSGNQLWTPTRQVGHISKRESQKKTNRTPMYIFLFLFHHCLGYLLCVVCWSICWPASRVIWSPIAPVIEVDVHWPRLNWPNSLTENSIQQGCSQTTDHRETPDSL